MAQNLNAMSDQRISNSVSYYTVFNATPLTCFVNTKRVADIDV